jgi:hypothetical protein
MGQYFYLVNVDKKQFIHPHQIGNGLKIGEQLGWKYSTEVVAKLLASERSDIHPLIGEWRGDHVGFAGDYGSSAAVEDYPLPETFADHEAVEAIYHACQECEEAPATWTDISAAVREMMTAVFGIKYDDEGWRKITEPDSTAHVRPAMTPDMIVSFPNG